MYCICTATSQHRHSMLHSIEYKYRSCMSVSQLPEHCHGTRLFKYIKYHHNSKDTLSRTSVRAGGDRFTVGLDSIVSNCNLPMFILSDDHADPIQHETPHGTAHYTT